MSSPLPSGASMEAIMAKLNELSSSTTAKLDDISATTSATRSEWADYRCQTDDKIKVISSAVDDVHSKVKSLEQKILQMEKRKPGLAQTSNNNDGISVELLKQFNLKNNVCIHGVPADANEDVHQIVKAIASLLSVEFGSGDILSAYRARPSNRSPGLIIVRLSSFEKKMQILTNKRKKKTLKVNELNLNLTKPDNKIYINSHLSPYFSSIHQKAKQACDEGKIKSCWIASNCVTIQLPNDERVLVKSLDELYAIVGSSSSSNEKINGRTIVSDSLNANNSNSTNINGGKGNGKKRGRPKIVNSTPQAAPLSNGSQNKSRKRKASNENRKAAKQHKQHNQNKEKTMDDTQTSYASDNTTSDFVDT